MQIQPGIFKDYDIRAVVDTELDSEGVERIGQSIAEHFHPTTVAVGRDMRTSGDDWFAALVRGLTRSGVNVLDLGLIATDMTYFASGTLDVDLAIMISASHNPPQYNGFKLVRRGAEGVSGETGIYAIRDLALSNTQFTDAETPGTVQAHDCMQDWVAHALSMVSAGALKPFRVVVDAGNGMAGKVVPEVEKHLPVTIERLFFELDGTFPNHLANPLLEETHGPIQEKIRTTQADLGIMFDGDGDRMFLLDERGRFVSGTITTAMVARQMLEKNPGSTVLYNAICGRVVPETVAANGGTSVRVRVGHALIKRDMRTHDAIFAGEHSGHYYFRNNFSADSGLIAALVVLELMSETGKKLSELVDMYSKYPDSGEINFSVTDKEAMMRGLEEHFADARSTDWLDGVSIWYSTWWANIRPSNTQPVLRVNVEAHSQAELDKRTREIVEYITAHGGSIADEH